MPDFAWLIADSVLFLHDALNSPTKTFISAEQRFVSTRKINLSSFNQSIKGLL
jgi:hypothetical protein